MRGTILVLMAACGSSGGPPTDPADLLVVEVSPQDVSLPVGERVQFTVVVQDSTGELVKAVAVVWGSANETIAMVDAHGSVLGVAVGTAQIIATVEGRADSSLVTVTPPLQPGDPFGREQRPYTSDSPWNTAIPAGASIDPQSAAMVETILASNNGRLRSDPTQFSYPIYFADGETPRQTLVCSGIVSINHSDGTRTTIESREVVGIPIPSEAVPSPGSDAQIIIIDTASGDEYDVYQFVPPNRCTNVTRYVGGAYRSAVETEYISRGAGVPYLSGLIRPWEIARGRIEHALAFGYDLNREERCVWPASKTDGDDNRPDAIPEGARLRLDPTLDVNSISGLDATGRIIARALQEYGMFLIDNSGANKIYSEDEVTAQWGSQLVATTVSAIPVERLQVLRLPDAYWASEYLPNHGDCVR